MTLLEAVVTTVDTDTVDVLQHLEGVFPGGVADLHSGSRSQATLFADWR